jgi:hypothetical protein
MIDPGRGCEPGAQAVLWRIKKGERLVFKKGSEKFEATADSLQIDRVDVDGGKQGDEVAMRLSQKAREGDVGIQGGISKRKPRLQYAVRGLVDYHRKRA